MNNGDRNTQNRVFQKISNIQNSIAGLKKDGINRFQNYKFFSKEQVLNKLKPLFEEQKLLVIISDSEMTAEYSHHEKEYAVKFLKKIKIIDLEDTNFEVDLCFWALGSNTELAKAKGSADSYAMKNFLSEIFLMLAE